jgi:hypothetical protein
MNTASSMKNFSIGNGTTVNAYIYHLTEYTDQEIETWTLPHKHNTIKLLRTSHKNYMKHIKKRGLQTLITTYMKH